MYFLLFNYIKSFYITWECVDVDFPNKNPGKYHCGCVIPEELKDPKDTSSIISLEPCWQIHKEDPEYCRRESKCPDEHDNSNDKSNNMMRLPR